MICTTREQYATREARMAEDAMGYKMGPITSVGSVYVTRVKIQANKEVTPVCNGNPEVTISEQEPGGICMAAMETAMTIQSIRASCSRSSTTPITGQALAEHQEMDTLHFTKRPKRKVNTEPVVIPATI